MKKLLAIGLAFLTATSIAQTKKFPPTPDKIYGQLFQDVQLQKILPDGKTFVDCTPKRKVADIMYDYGLMKGANMNLKKSFIGNQIIRFRVCEKMCSKNTLFIFDSCYAMGKRIGLMGHTIDLDGI